jgi:hypothetical protein
MQSGKGLSFDNQPIIVTIFLTREVGLFNHSKNRLLMYASIETINEFRSFNRNRYLCHCADL